MTDEDIPRATQIVNLEAENDQRLKRALAAGFPMQQTAVFNDLRVLTYLETLLAAQDKLEDANFDFANKASGILDQIEQVLRHQKIVSGSSLKPEDIDKIIQIRPNGKG